MLIRIVQMTFEPEKVKDFLVLFEKNKDKIRNFEGCHHLELLKDYHSDNKFTTYSHWRNESYLEAYRNSELFKEVWEETRSLFAEKASAQSLKRFIEVA